MTRKRPRRLLPLLPLVQLPPVPGAVRPFPLRWSRAFPGSRQPIKADRTRRKTMTTVDFTLVIDALVRLVAALTAFVIALRRHRR